jgi:hypothetical protein
VPVKPPTDSDPETALIPDHPFEAEHEVALVDVQVKVAFWPQETEPLEVKSTVGIFGQLHLHQPLPQRIVPPAVAHCCCSKLLGLPDKVAVQISSWPQSLAQLDLVSPHSELQTLSPQK